MGAGPVGGTLGCRLAGAGISVAVIDHAALPPMEHPAFDGRAYAIAAGARALLDDSGLWDMLDVPPHPIREIRVSDGRVGRPPSRLHLHFDYREATQEARPFGWMVEARSLRKALNTRFPKQPGLHLFAPAKASVTLSEDGAVVRLDDGTTIQCRLVVAAEGRNSPLRQQAGIRVTRIPYHQTGIVCAIAHERPHNDTALEHFLPAGLSPPCRWVQAQMPSRAARRTFPPSSGPSAAGTWHRSWLWMMPGLPGKSGGAWARIWVQSAPSGGVGPIRYPR